MQLSAVSVAIFMVSGLGSALLGMTFISRVVKPKRKLFDRLADFAAACALILAGLLFLAVGVSQL